MSSNIKTLRNRIKSIDSTLHLTKAMELVASSKMYKANDEMLKANSYKDEFLDVFNNILNSLENDNNPFLKEEKDEKICLLVIAGDRGLAGGYNANVIKYAREYNVVKTIAIGKKSCEYYGLEVIRTEQFDYKKANDLAKEICDDFLENKFNKFGIVYTKYISIISSKPEIEWLLPLKRDKNKINLSVVEPSVETILNMAIYEYLASVIISRVKESYVCEICARKVAMNSAGKNAKDMMDELKIEYNRQRQGAITQEITEIVAGSDL